MKIGFRIENLSYGGGERMLLMLIDEMSKQGHEIFVFTWTDIPLNHVAWRDRAILLARKRNKVEQFVYEVYKVSKELIRLKLDCFIQFGLYESFLLSTKISNTHSIFSLRVDPHFTTSQQFFRPRLKLSFLLCSGIVFQTEKVRQLFSKKIREKSVVISNPIIDDFLPEPCIKRKKRIVSVGRLSPEKNFHMLINAFVHLNPKNYTLHIYGQGSLGNELKELIGVLGFNNRVFLEGHVEKVVNHIRDAEIFVMSSNFEGMPNVLIEAMAMKLACVSTKFPSGASEELIVNNENGILISTNNQAELVRAFEKIISNNVFKSKLMNNAYKVREKLNKAEIVGDWLSFIETVRNY